MPNPADLSTAGNRFEWFIVECYGSVYSYAEKFGFNASQVYRTISNNSTPRLETLVLYALTGLNIHWMGTGKGNWWSPDDAGRELARRKGIIVTDDGDGKESLSIDYKSLVHTIFEIAEESVLERFGQHQVTENLGRPAGSRVQQENMKSE